MSKRVHFIDCGANVGQSIDWALEEFGDNITIDSFEPQEENFVVLEEKYGDHKNINLHQAAVWVKDAVRDFYPQMDGARTSSSLIAERFMWYNSINMHTNPEISEEGHIIAGDPTLVSKIPWKVADKAMENKTEVECINLSKWLKKNLSSENHNILKIDIEGAEYRVLPHLFKNKIEDIIDKWIVEFHDDKVASWLVNPKARKQLNEKVGVDNWKDWHAEQPGKHKDE